MTSSNFNTTTEWLLVHEGGYVNHPKDPGGATNKGVTQRVYDSYRRRQKLPIRSVKSIELSEVFNIYRTQYWDAADCDLMPNGLDYAVYDFSVNSGPKRAIQFLQRILKVKDDGIVGNVTLGAIAIRDINALIVEYCEARFEWLKTLKTWDTFGKGWTRRVMGEKIGVQETDTGVIDRAVKMHLGAQVAAPTIEAPGKALVEDTKFSVAALDFLADKNNLIKAAMGAIPGALAAIAAVPEGPAQWVVGGILVISFGAVAYEYLQRIQAGKLEAS